MQHDWLCPAATTTPAATTAARSAATWSTATWSATTRGAATARRAATRSTAAATARASACARSASPSDDSPGQSESIIVRHFEVPGDSPRLRDPCDHLPGNHPAFDIQYRRIPDLRHRPAYLAGCIHLEIEHDRLPAASAAAAPRTRFGSGRSVFLRFKRRRNIVRLPFPRQFGLSINAGGRGQ
jgi:hypothetical protein